MQDSPTTGPKDSDTRLDIRVGSVPSAGQPGHRTLVPWALLLLVLTGLVLWQVYALTALSRSSAAQIEKLRAELHQAETRAAGLESRMDRLGKEQELLQERLQQLSQKDNELAQRQDDALWQQKVDRLLPRIPEKENAAFRYQEAMDGLADEDAVAELVKSFDRNDASWPKRAVAFVERNRTVLEKAQQALATDQCRFEFELDQGFSAAMPYLAKARSLARLLVVAGQLRECQGDAAGAVKQYLAAVRLGCDVAQGGSVVSSLVDVACADLGLTALEGCMRTLPDDPPLWKAILGQMAMIEKRRWPLANALRVETLGGERTFSMLMTGQVDLRELNDDLGGLRLTRDDLNRSKLTYLAYMSALIRAAEGGFTAFREKMPMAKDRVRDDPLTGLLVNALDRVFFVTSRARFRLDAFRLMAALRLWKSVKHAYPNDLAELVPDYLPVVPRDPFADAALRYVLTGDKVMIYSVGPDGDDDKGQVECPSEQLGPDTNGDLVLRMPK